LDGHDLAVKSFLPRWKSDKSVDVGEDGVKAPSLR
jgi:hypothetical protein